MNDKFEVGQKVTVVRQDGSIYRITTVTTVGTQKFHARKVTLADGSEWTPSGISFSQRKTSYYNGPTIRPYDPEDTSILIRQRSVRLLSTTKWDKVSDVDLVVIMAILGKCQEK